MLDLTKIIPLAVLGASILGSTHCIAMCGGLALSRSQTKADLFLYHSGRLVGYVTLGALAGAVGSRIFSPSVAVWMSWVASVLMGAVFFALAYRTWNGKTPHFSILPPSWFARLYRGRGAFGTGLLTAALPCGWLQSFVLSAVATQSALHGGFLLLFFWLGTLPALAALPVLTKKLLVPIAARTPRVAAIFLVIAGIASLGVRAYHAPFVVTPESEAGHSESCGH